MFLTPHLYLNELVNFFTFIQLSTCVHEFNHSLLIPMLKPLFTNYIFHLL